MNRIRRFAAVFPLLAASVALAGDLEDAKALRESGKFEEALPKFQAAAAADPTSAEAALGLSQTLAGLGRYEEATKAVDAARKAHPEDAALAAAKGRAFFLAYMKASSEAEPDQAAVDMYRSGAEKWLGTALKIDVKNVEALLTRGQLWRKDGDEEKAGSFFEQAAAADPKNFDAVFARADYWYVKANGGNKSDKELWAKAASGFNDALRIDPTSGRAALNLARCMAWSKLPNKDVAAAYQKAAELSPDDDAPLSALYGYVPKAERVATFQKLADALPKNVRRKLFLAFALMEEKHYEKALDVVSDASKLEPKNPYVYVTEGDIRLAWGKIDDAIGNYGEAANHFQGKIDDKTFAKLGYTIGFKHAGLTQDQREHLWVLLWRNFPDRSGLWNDIGLTYRDQVKDFKRSLEWYLRAAKAAPEDVCILNDTGLIYHYHMDDLDKAEPYYRKAAELGKARNYKYDTGQDPDRGYRDAVNNMHIILAKQKRWADLKKFAEENAPEGIRELWIKEAEEKGK
jgi:tetratricopeptide (TPR) repeat protein